MTSMSFSLIAIMITGLLLTGGVAGIVLFIVGLVKRRPAMWATGLVLGAMAMLMMLVAVGGAMFVAMPIAVTAVPGTTATSPTLLTTMPASPVVSTFEECTGLALPSGAGVQRGMTSSSSSSGGQTKDCLLALTVGSDFGAFLDANFQKATWQQVSSALAGPLAVSRGMWTPKDVQGVAYYTLTHSGGDAAAGPEATQTWTTAVAYNAKTSQAYVVSVGKKAGK
jgi:hypothetical protein